ncbi:MAG: serine/threonine-protein kinase, partial [Planctomycetaceae bacterium]
MTIQDGQPTDQASAPLQPERVGPYVIESKIGAGGMGTVYHGRHAETGDEAAVKVLPASLAREEGFVARFFREIEALKKLVDPHVVRLYESGVDGETYYYAMEYIDGETLTARLRREKRIPWRETIEIAIEICAALKAAHDAGVVHRDLKPSNLLLARDGSVKLTDFGVAQIFAENRLTVTGGIIGTAEYMSPEQAQGKRATKKSDLYSLGAVMYVMLTGRPPFRGKSTLDVIQQQRYGQFDRPRRMVPEIPSWLDEIVVQLLEKDPEKRFADAYVLMRRLQEVLRKVELSDGDDETRASGARGGTGPTVAAGTTVARGPGVAPGP